MATVKTTPIEESKREVKCKLLNDTVHISTLVFEIASYR